MTPYPHLSAADSPRWHFFLGGRDLEMETIQRLLQTCEVETERIHDHGLSWGARASDYADQIDQVLRSNGIPVLIELEPDLDLPNDRIIDIDHHGVRAGATRPTSLEQVFKLLGCTSGSWTREFDLVAANDRGAIGALRSIGATEEEIKDIRARDRRAQGVSEEEEKEGEIAVAEAEAVADGRLLIVRSTTDRTAPSCDRIALAPVGEDLPAILVLGPGEVNFFGCGAAIDRLRKIVTGPSWYGGALPAQGYWGAQRKAVEQAGGEAVIGDSLKQFYVGER